MSRSTLLVSLFQRNPRRRQHTASRQRLSFESLETKDLLAVVALAAGSTDGLAAAIAAAGEGGTVVVESGLHNESSGVTVGFPVSIIGEPGAVIRVTTAPVFDPSAEAALDVQGADHALIEGISLEASSGAGNVGIRIEDSNHVIVRNNVITDYLFGVFVKSGEHNTITGNTITGLPDDDIGYCCVGILTGSVAHTRINGNDVSDFDAGYSPQV